MPVRGEVTQVDSMIEYAILSRCRTFKSVGVLVCMCREGKVACTCVSHLEASLLNDLHLFSDL